MTNPPYTTIREFETWVREERKRVVVEQNADLIRLIQTEGLLGRIEWAPTAGSLSSNPTLGLILRPHPFSPLEWERQIMDAIGGDRLLLPIEGTQEHMTIRWEGGGPTLSIPDKGLEAAAKQYGLQVHFATWDREIAGVQGRLDLFATRRTHMINRLGPDHVSTKDPEG